MSIKGFQIGEGSVQKYDYTELDNKPTVPVVDATLTTTGAAADAKKTGDEIADLKSAINVLEPSATSSDIGKALIAKTVSGGKVTSYEFGEADGGIDPSDVADAVEDWLDDHPEATTTVEDGSLTEAKFTSATQKKTVKEYVTPEMFGAVGDASTDDTTALQDCITYAKTNYKAVRGYNRYKTSGTISISGNYQDIEIERITYTGSDYAVSISGSYSNIKFGGLYCASGKGLLVSAAQRNKIYTMRLFSDGHGVTLDGTNSNSVLYNTFDIRTIKSDSGDCYHNNGGLTTENVFMNTTCACEAGWAIYNLHGRFNNFSLESDVLNGLYNCTGYFSGFRIRELVDKIVHKINGDAPSATGGALIKFSGYIKGVFRFSCEDFIPYASVDVSEAESVEDMAEVSQYNGQAPYFAHYKFIDAPIIYGDWNTKNGYCVPAKGMIISGDRKVCIPAYETVKTITNASFDMRDAQVLLNNAEMYPTRMIIDVDNCVIHLSPSYSPYGYSEFIVDQTHGHTCTIYDSNSDVTPIFNGSMLGSGIYKLKAYCDPSDNVVIDIRERQGYQSDIPLNDGTNYSWAVEQIGNNCGVTNVSDYGAVGDGTTDDSAAIQAACNAGYDVYFESNKTYYIPTTVTIDHDIHLHGGENTKIITKTPTGGILNTIFNIKGTCKKITTLTTDYSYKGNTANSGNKFTLDDMTDIEIGDVMIITATDQFYSYARSYYYLGGSLLIGDIYDGHLYTTNSMPFNIELTANVTAEIYHAPTAIIENLNFEADLDSHGNYKYFILMEECKNSDIRNCNFTMMDSGICLMKCVNTSVENIEMSKSEEVEITGDGYSILVASCSNTIIQRFMAICSQSGISLSGTIPNMNTFVRYCELASECRRSGLAMHENSYNIVVEDCVLAGLNVLGTGIVNRCRLIKNNRSDSDGGITFCGSHNPEWAVLKVNDCTFDSPNGIYVYNPSEQDPIQTFDNIIGLIEVNRCRGGQFTFQSRSSEWNLSNVIKKVKLTEWEDCYEIYHPNAGDVIEKMSIVDCTFGKRYWLNKHQDAINFDDIYDTSIRSMFPMEHKVNVNKDTHGYQYTLPKNTTINFSSNNQSAKFGVCGNNVGSTNASEYVIGSVSGSDGGTLTRTVASGTIPTLSNDTNGNLVYTQLNNESKYNFYPFGLFYIKDASFIKMSCTLKNTGNTDPASFKPYIAVVDCETGNLITRKAGSAVQATAQGASMSLEYLAKGNCVAMCYFHCSTAVALSETTLEDYVAYVSSLIAPITVDSIEPYESKTRTGNGTILSLSGVNNLMSSEMNFHINFCADYVAHPVGLLLN